MYILHLLVVYFFGVNNIDIGVFKPVLVFIITALISYVIFIINKKLNIRML